MNRELMLLAIIGVGIIIVTVYILIFVGFLKKKFKKKTVPAVEDVRTEEVNSDEKTEN